MAEPGERELHAWLDAFWQRERPAVLARLEPLERLAATLATGGQPDPEQREAARAEAHKLAGMLGTFGLGEGSEIAAAVEATIDAGPSAADAAALREGVERLRAVIEGA